MSFYEKLIFATYDRIGGGGLRATVCCFHCLQDQRHSICINKLKIVYQRRAILTRVSPLRCFCSYRGTVAIVTRKCFFRSVKLYEYLFLLMPQN